MLQECLMSGCQRKFYMENCKKESAHKRYKDTLKASLKDFNIPTESWEQAAQDRTKWVASSAKVPPNLKQRESVKLKGSVKKGFSKSNLLYDKIGV